MTAEEFHSVAADARRECLTMEILTLRQILFGLQNQATLISQRIDHLEADVQGQTEYLKNRKVPFKAGTPPA